MNLSLLTSVFKANREYANMTAALRQQLSSGRYRPMVATGLSEGAADVFLPALAQDFADMCVLILSPEERDAAATAAQLASLGLRVLHYPARDYNFNNITSSHDYEHERLQVLSALMNDPEPLIISATPEAALQITLPQELLLQMQEE